MLCRLRAFPFQKRAGFLTNLHAVKAVCQQELCVRTTKDHAIHNQAKSQKGRTYPLSWLSMAATFPYPFTGLGFLKVRDLLLELTQCLSQVLVLIL
jgi:hypothetical protein